MKRRAAIQDQEVYWEAFGISKADWTELYFDLYRQTHGETVSEQEIIEDAKHRLSALKLARQQ